MLPVGKSPGHLTAIAKKASRNFPDMIDFWKDVLFVGEQDSNAPGPGVSLPADRFFSRTIKRRKGFIEQ